MQRKQDRDYKYQLVDALIELARKDAYIALQEQLIEAARQQDDKTFLALLPEYDFRRLTVYAEQRER